MQGHGFVGVIQAVGHALRGFARGRREKHIVVSDPKDLRHLECRRHHF